MLTFSCFVFYDCSIAPITIYVRLDEETEELHHERVPQTLGKTMQQARDAKGWSQKDLATVSHLPYHVLYLITAWLG